MRYLSTIGMHTGGMTIAQSERMFRDKSFQDPGNARQRDARGTYDRPTSTTPMGKLMITQMRQDGIARHPGPNALKAFNDQSLRYGGPPIPMVRQRMLGGEVVAKLWTKGEAGDAPVTAPAR